jgi:hypothetical protein
MRWAQGVVVEVRPAAEILASLDEQGTLDGIPFMPEMLRFCGQRFVVSRRLNKTCSEDPPDGHRMRHFPSGDIVYLDALRCDGAAHDGCGRACMLFWKEAWLHAPEGSLPARDAEAPAAATPSRLRTRTPDGAYLCQSTALAAATRPASRGRQLRAFAWDVLHGSMGLRQALSYLLVPLWMICRNALGYDIATRGSNEKTPDQELDLKPGDWVRVKTRTEIAATLDRSGRNRGLEFTPVMHECSGKVFRVGRRVDRMILEASGRMREIRNTVILDTATCRGAVILGGCPRNEFHLWREIWLTRVDPPTRGGGGPTLH